MVLPQSQLITQFSIIALSLKLSPTVGITWYTAGGCDNSIFDENTALLDAQTTGELWGDDCNYNVQPDCVDDISDFYYSSYTTTCISVGGQIVTYDLFYECQSSINTLTVLNAMFCADLTCELEDYPDPDTYDGEGDLEGCTITQSNFRMGGDSGTPSQPFVPETDSPSYPSISGTDPPTTFPISDTFPTISPNPDTFPTNSVPTNAPFSRPPFSPPPINSSVMPIGVTGAIMLTSITIALADILFPNIAF